jgi:YesN/AraC family two-component response regulator
LALKTDFDWIFEHFFITRVEKIGQKCSYPYHHHAAYEMYYLLSGERTFFIAGTNYHIKHGDLVLIDRHDLHKPIDYERMKRNGFLLSFQEDFLEPMLDEQKRIKLLSIFKKKVIRFTAVEQRKLEQLFNKIARESSTKDAQTVIYVRLLLCELLILLGRKCDQADDADIRRSEPKDRKIEEITAYIYSQYMKRLSLDQIANMFYISKFHLSRMFKEVTGFTIVEYIRSTRVQEAQKLLEGSDLNMTHIAERTGFDSPTHFGRVFKECTGLSPLKYRKQFM